jgi:HlyD family secretion protein
MTKTANPKSPLGALSSRKLVFGGLLTVAILVFGFGLWSVGTTISGAIVAPGQLEVDQNRQIVQHPDGGVVESISVTEAQTVQAGDLLITLDGSLLKSELSIVEGQLFESQARFGRLVAERDDKDEITFSADLLALAAQRSEVAEQVEGQKRLFIARKDTLARQIDQLHRRMEQIAAQVQGVEAQIKSQLTQSSLIDRELDDKKALLAKGLTQNASVLELERRIAALEGSVGELQASKASSEGRATEVELEILRLEAVRREEANTQLREIGPQILELAERRRALMERVARLEIRAPVSGIVLGLQVTTPRAVLRAADPVLYLIPQDRPLVIVAQLSPLHVDEVYVGQEVVVTFAAFSARTTPVLKGRLVSISADALQDQASKTSFYRAEITLEPGEVDKLDGQVLLPGMPVQSMIATGPHTPMAYLLKPFTDYFNLAFRES